MNFLAELVLQYDDANLKENLLGIMVMLIRAEGNLQSDLALQNCITSISQGSLNPRAMDHMLEIAPWVLENTGPKLQ